MSENMVSLSYSPYMDEMYELWLQDPGSVDQKWHEFFTLNGKGDGVARTFAPTSSPDTRIVSSEERFPRNRVDSMSPPGPPGALVENPGNEPLVKQGRVNSLLWAYRDVGYIYAKINPLEGYMTPDQYYRLFTIEGEYESLTLKEFGLGEEDLNREFYAGRFMQPGILPLGDLVQRLKKIYCGSIGSEILHIQNKAVRKWLINHLEGPQAHQGWTNDEKVNIQKDLIRAEEFEHFIHTNFVGQKRFSLEGAESLIPALRHLVTRAADHGLQELVFGMPHRGRLNVLVNALGKEPVSMFAAFVDNYTPHTYGGSGDVKYHQGYSYDYYDEETGRTIHLSLVANPSHLEAVDPVVEGKTRGIQRRRGDRLRKKVMPVLIHGDAAFSGQGVVAETLNLSQLRGYRTGGTIHIIVNNQIGFTTASRDARSTFFATDIAKSIAVPILHVNGDDPEAVIQTIDLAARFRQKFATDVVIDMVCYRRLGHNEADEPSFTHPKMYGLIHELESVRVQYGKKLEREGVWLPAEQEAYKNEYRNFLKTELDHARGDYIPKMDDAYQEGIWKKYRRAYSFEPVTTGVNMSTLSPIAQTLTKIPDNFKIHPKLERFVEERRVQFFEEKKVDWAFAESLAYGSILLDGFPVRLSGEDCGRGTFSQRHAVWWDHSSEVPVSHLPLRHISPNQGFFAVYDSPLSEFSVLGFEYGYSIALPDALIMWEAQFGDFVNGAQVIIDQYIVAGETKWFRSSGLVLLHPHGYEGQGPEHSSAHLERFLSLCAEKNIQVVYPTTPAQYFHVLRRQVHQPFRKPLVVMTPKSLLRNKVARSPVPELVTGHFHNVIDDSQATGNETRVLLCSGKVYYDLIAKREKRQLNDTAIIRLEQIYPFPVDELKRVCERYTKAKAYRWVQEESRNRGAWYFVFQRYADFIPPAFRLEYTGRPSGASPSTGSHKQHVEELQVFLDGAFGPLE